MNTPILPTITNLRVITGSSWEVVPEGLRPGLPQYLDRRYVWKEVPAEYRGMTFIRTCGCDKLIDEKHVLARFLIDQPADVFVLYATKFPRLPHWLEAFEPAPGLASREDSDQDTRKGFFHFFRRRFPVGEVALGGCCPSDILSDLEYATRRGATYCMYSVAIAPAAADLSDRGSPRAASQGSAGMNSGNPCRPELRTLLVDLKRRTPCGKRTIQHHDSSAARV